MLVDTVIEVYVPYQSFANSFPDHSYTPIIKARLLEIKTEVEAAIATTGAKGPQDMGKVMGILTGKLAGKADGKVIANTVKTLLNK